MEATTSIRCRGTFTGHARAILTGIGLAGLLACSGMGLAGTETQVRGSERSLNEAASYEGPRARIAVASFECKADDCYREIGRGLADMMSTALFQSNRFVVLERGEGLGDVLNEVDLAESGYADESKAAQKGTLEGADILLQGAVTAFEAHESGGGGGGIAIPRAVPLVGGAKVGRDNAYLAIDLRLVDVRRGRVVNATRVEGEASSFDIGGFGGGIASGVALAGGMSAYENTPMEKAIAVMIDKAVVEIGQKTPEDYFRYGE